MQKAPFMKTFFLIFFLCFSSIVSAQNTLNTEAFGIDEQNRIIVINHDVNDFNTIFGGKSFININSTHTFFFTNADDVQVGNKYDVNYNGKMYNLYFSQLPIIKMEVADEIKDSPKVYGTFKLYAPGAQPVSSVMGVEYRGASSQAYPKKSMEVEFYTDETHEDEQDISLLGLRATSGFNLQAMYNEALRSNSITANDLWQEIHPDVYYRNKEPEARSGIQMKYAEIFLNGQYRGIYAVGEKVNRKSLQLKKYKDNQIKGELYKGDSHGGAVLFTSLDDYDNDSPLWSGYEYKHPKEKTDWSNLHSLIDFALNSDQDQFSNQYATKFDAENLIDYFIFLNVLRATDNTGKNIHLAKYDKNEKYFYVPWDLDGVFGTIWDGSNENVVDDLLFNGLYQRLWTDVKFRSDLANRWTALRQDIITKEHLTGMISTNRMALQQNLAYEREQIVWDGFPFADAQWEYQKDWIERRINYLDTVFVKLLDVAQTDASKAGMLLYPNPTADFVKIQINEKTPVLVHFYDMNGRMVLRKQVQPDAEIPVAQLQPGTYLVHAVGAEKQYSSRLIIRK